MTGSQGPAGANGLAATVSVEPTVQVPFSDNPYVLNVGTKQNAILRFGIPAGVPGEQGPQGERGPQGVSGPASAIIPFSIGSQGVTLTADEHGAPIKLAPSGFSPTHYNTASFFSLDLEEGEWNTGIITVRDSIPYITSFIMPTNGVLKKCHVMFSSVQNAFFSEGAVVRPFVCLAISDTDDRVYKILQNSIVYADSYEGDPSYPIHTTRRGSRSDLNVEIPEGSLVAIIAGIMATNVSFPQSGAFTISGGLHLE